MRIAIAGGTGTVGRHAVDAARERGHEVVVLTRSNGIDLVSGDGLADALDGVGGRRASGPGPTSAAYRASRRASRRMARARSASASVKISGGRKRSDRVPEASTARPRSQHPCRTRRRTIMSRRVSCLTGRAR